MARRIWNPDAALAGVRLNDATKTAIRDRMTADRQPLEPDGTFFADAVFEGGGVWGVAHVGAVQCFEDAGAKWVSVGGTSAGAIVAGLLAAGYTAAELTDAFSHLNYMDFLQDTTYFGFDRNPGDDLESPRELAALIGALAMYGKLGRYRTGPFVEWYAGLLAAKGVTTFADVFREVAPGRRRQLRVIGTDLSHGCVRVLPDQMQTPRAGVLKPEDPLPAELRGESIAEAVRCSISLPGFFEPARLPPGNSCVVDGGLVNNFPIWLFDSPSGQTPGWPTFGFRLGDTPDAAPAPVNTVADLLRRMTRTLLSASDGQHVLGREDRVVSIDVTDLGGRPAVSATAFDADAGTLEALYRVGYDSAKRFLTTRWSWATHVQRRTGHRPA